VFLPPAALGGYTQPINIRIVQWNFDANHPPAEIFTSLVDIQITDNAG
jgi:hypothetical protein